LSSDPHKTHTYIVSAVRGVTLRPQTGYRNFIYYYQTPNIFCVSKALLSDYYFDAFVKVVFSDNFPNASLSRLFCSSGDIARFPAPGVNNHKDIFRLIPSFCTIFYNIPLKFFSKLFCMTKATNLYVVMIYMTEFQQFSNRVTLHFSFQHIDLHQNPVNLTLSLRNLYT